MKAEWKVIGIGHWGLILGERNSASLFQSYQGHFVCGLHRFTNLEDAQTAAERAVLTHLHEEVAALTDLIRGKEANT